MGGHFGPLFCLFDNLIPKSSDFHQKSTILLFHSYECGMTPITWHCRNIKFLKNLSPYNQMVIMKMCDLRPILVIFDLKWSRANLSDRDQI